MTAARHRHVRWAARAPVAVLAAGVLALGACGGDDSDGAQADGESAGGASEAFCDKAADFEEATDAVGGIASADQMQAAVDQLAGVAAEAPNQMEDEFDALTGVLDRLVVAMRTSEGRDERGDDRGDAEGAHARDRGRGAGRQPQRRGVPRGRVRHRGRGGR